MVWKLTLIPVFHLLDNLPKLQVQHQHYFERLDNLMVLCHQRWSMVEGHPDLSSKWLLQELQKFNTTRHCRRGRASLPEDIPKVCLTITGWTKILFSTKLQSKFTTCSDSTYFWMKDFYQGKKSSNQHHFTSNDFILNNLILNNIKIGIQLIMK